MSCSPSLRRRAGRGALAWRAARPTPALVLLLGALVGGAASGACADEAAAAAVDDRLPALEPIMEDLARLRRLEFLRDVPAEPQSLEEFGAYVDEQLDEYLGEDERDGIMIGLVHLGLLAEPIDLAGEFRDALLSQAGAYYDPVDERFYYLMLDMPEVLLEGLAAHELTHALQDQHFDLERLLAPSLELPEGAPRPDDALLAVSFLVEGDATLVQTLAMLADMGLDATPDAPAVAAALRAQASMDLDELAEANRRMMGGEENAITAAMEAMDEIPPYIIVPLLAAYLDGAVFAQQVAAAGGWRRLDAAYHELPLSTEQVLHPEKYLAGARDDPAPIDLPAFTALDGGDWQRLDAAIHGELYLRVLLETLGVDREQAATATAGWDGDVYAAWRGPDDAVLVLLATTWDDAQHAREFRDAYLPTLLERFPDLAPAAGSRGPDRMLFDCGDGHGTGALLLRDREVFALHGAPLPVTESLVEQLLALEVPAVR